MKDILTGIFNVFLYSALGVLFVYLINRFSLVLFNLRLAEEIKSGNKAAAIFGLGVFILVGLIIGLIIH